MFSFLIKVFIFTNVFLNTTCFSIPLCRDNASTTNHLNYLGSKTPYRVVQNLDTTPYFYPGCNAQNIWMFIRHGTRQPSAEVIRMFHKRLPKLRDEILKNNYLSLQGTLCDKDLEAFLNWRVQVEINNEKHLSREGEVEMAALAKRMLTRLPHLLDNNYSNHSYKLRHTASQRTHQSAKYFAEGLFRQQDHGKVWFPVALKEDPVLRFYKLCTKWKVTVDKNPEASLAEYHAFQKGTHYTAMRNSLAQYLGLLTISIEDVQLMYAACAFESAWDKASTSPWCAAFGEQDLQVIEYSEDLKYFWTDGYGHEVNHQQACSPVMDMLDTFQESLTSKTDTTSPLGVFYFTHSGAILKVLAYMGLFYDPIPLRHSTFELHRHTRQWRVSRIDTFGSNLAAILFWCEEEPKVMVLHQERHVHVHGCPELPALCPLSTLLKHFSNCPFDEVCALNHHHLDL